MKCSPLEECGRLVKLRSRRIEGLGKPATIARDRRRGRYTSEMAVELVDRTREERDRVERRGSEEAYSDNSDTENRETGERMKLNEGWNFVFDVQHKGW